MMRNARTAGFPTPALPVPEIPPGIGAEVGKAVVITGVPLITGGAGKSLFEGGVSVASGVAETVSGAANTAAGAARFAGALMDPNTWIRAGFVLGGAMLVVGGIAWIFSDAWAPQAIAAGKTVVAARTGGAVKL